MVNVAIQGGTAATTHRLLREFDRRSPDIVHIVKPRAHAGLVQWWLATTDGGRGKARLLLDVDDWEQAWEPVNRYPWPVATLSGLAGGMGHPPCTGDYSCQSLVGATGADLLAGCAGALPAEWHRQSSWFMRTYGSRIHAGVVLFFTRFVEVTADWFAEFCVSLYARRPQTKIVVAGTPVQPGLDEPFRRQVAASPAAAAVEWTGFVPPADLPGTLCQNRLRHLPSCRRAAPTGKMQRAPGHNHAPGSAGRR